MEETEGVIRLFYELSSETRLSILHELDGNPAKMNELVKKLGARAKKKALRRFTR
jgi:hypothetical protein